MGYLLFHAAASPLMTPTPALLGDQSHSFLDNTIALFGHIRAWDCSPESRRYGQQPKGAGCTDRDRPRQHAAALMPGCSGRPDTCNVRRTTDSEAWLPPYVSRQLPRRSSTNFLRAATTW